MSNPFDDAIELFAEHEFPNDTTAQAVAKYLHTPQGTQMYEFHDFSYREAVHKSASAAPDDFAFIEAFAEILKKRDPNLTEAQATARAFDKIVG